jgi:hypothetical protein
MVFKKIWVIMLFSLILLTGGCGAKDDESINEPADKNALEEYSSTLLNSLSKAKKAQLQASLPAIRLQINRYKQEQGRYPDSLEDLSLPPDIPLALLDYSAETGEVSLKQ